MNSWHFKIGETLGFTPLSESKRCIARMPRMACVYVITYTARHQSLAVSPYSEQILHMSSSTPRRFMTRSPLQKSLSPSIPKQHEAIPSRCRNPIRRPVKEMIPLKERHAAEAQLCENYTDHVHSSAWSGGIPTLSSGFVSPFEPPLMPRTAGYQSQDSLARDTARRLFPSDHSPCSHIRERHKGWSLCIPLYA